MAKLNYKNLLAIEHSLTNSVIAKIKKGLSKVFEGKDIKFVGTDFDKNIYFYVDSVAKRAQWEINENDISFSGMADLEIDKDAFKSEFENTIVEAINKLSVEEFNESDELFNKAFDIAVRELTEEKLRLFRPVKKVIRESVHKVKAVKKIVEKKETVSELVENLRKIISKFIGEVKVMKDDKITVNLTESKVIQPTEKSVRQIPFLRKVMLAKEAARKLDLKPMIENTQKFLSEHEEVLLLKSTEVKSMLESAAKEDISATDSSINEAFAAFIKTRGDSEDLKSVLKEAFGDEQGIEDTESGEGDKGDEGEVKKDLDSEIGAMDDKYSEEKLGFMKAFVEVISKIFEKVKELATDNDIKARADRAMEEIKRQTQESEKIDSEGWDKEKLEEIAKEAIELAASIEGIEPKKREEKQVDQAKDETEAEEDSIESKVTSNTGDVGETTTESIDTEDNLLLDMPSEESEESGESEIEGIEEEEMEDCHCFQCDKDFGVVMGTDEMHCPYCQAAISADFDSMNLPDEVPGQENTEVPSEEKDEVAIGNVHPQKDEEFVRNPNVRPAGLKVKKEVAALNIQPQEGLVREMESKPDAIQGSEKAISGSPKVGASVKYTKTGAEKLLDKRDNKSKLPSKPGPASKDTMNDNPPTTETSISADAKVGSDNTNSKAVMGKELSSKEDTKNKSTTPAAGDLKDPMNDEDRETEDQINPEGKVGAGTPGSQKKGSKELKGGEDNKNSLPEKPGPASKDTSDKAPKTEKKISEADAKAGKPMKTEITDDDFAGKPEEDIYAEEPIEGEEAPVDMPAEEPVADEIPLDMPAEEPVAEGGDVVSMVSSQVLDAIVDVITADEIKKWTEDHIDHYEENTGKKLENRQEIVDQIFNSVIEQLEETTDEIADNLKTSETGTESLNNEVPVEAGEGESHEALETHEEEDAEHVAGDEPIETDEKLEEK